MGETKSRHPLKDYVLDKLQRKSQEYYNLTMNNTLTEEDRLRLSEEIEMLYDIKKICEERSRW